MSKKKKAPPENDTHLTSENTAVLEYLDIIRHEYDCASDIKASFENRAGILLSLLGAICVFLFDKIKISEVIAICNSPLYFGGFIQIVFGFGVYIGFLLSFVMLIITIRTRKHKTFEVKGVANVNLEEERYKALVRLIGTYQEAVIQRVEVNEIRAKCYRYALYGVAITLTSAVIYTAF